MVDGNSETTKHEILGQSVIFPKFEAFAFALGMMFMYDLNFKTLDASNDPLNAEGVDAQSSLPDPAAWIAAHADDYLLAA